MPNHTVLFDITDKAVQVPTGALLSDAAHLAGVELNQPCGGQGRCGRCAVQVTSGSVRARSTLRLSAEDVANGYVLGCQAVVEGDVTVHVPPQEKIERRLTTDRTAAEVQVPSGYDPLADQTVRRMAVTLKPPTMDDQIDDWSRLKWTLQQEIGRSNITISLALLRTVGKTLREGDWQVSAVLDHPRQECCPDCPARLIDLRPGLTSDDDPLWGIAVDIGTTTVSLWLVDLLSGRVRAQVAEYNQQISRGEDVISRIIYASKGDGGEQLRDLVVGTINDLVERACKRVRAKPADIVKATISGNTTMIHLLLGLPAASIRLSPFVPGVNEVPLLRADEVGLHINPEANVDCLPGVASYVGADITAGVLSSGMADSEQITLFLDVGTNGEMVLGSSDWLVTCACSAGPAFEGAGVVDGMRATRGAIEEVWVHSETYEPSWRVIGAGGPREVKPKGICGSGLISLMAELFITGVLDKRGNVNTTLDTPRVRQGAHGGEYVVAWGSETEHGRDIVLTHVDVDNLLRAKAAIYAGFTILADSVGVPLEMAERVLIGGSFGKYINVEKAVQLGLLPDMPWERFQFLGNTSVRGAYLALLSRESRAHLQDIASRMTYIELSADNRFFEAFTSACFLPHTDMSMFPSVAEALA
ncbi:MAG TPA: DUF4445 domain-containing protein [Caldilineae bacterium]|nr:DUF4445 domain-containing protein [Caldilineae bacterium]